MKFAVPLANLFWAPLGTMVSTSAIDGAVQRKMHGREDVRLGKGR